MSELFLFQLLYYIAATVMFALGMKFNFYYITGQKSFGKCLSTFIKWYDSNELSPEPGSKSNTFKLVSNGCNLIVWIGLIIFIGLFIYTQYFQPLPYDSKYYMN